MPFSSRLARKNAARVDWPWPPIMRRRWSLAYSLRFISGDDTLKPRILLLFRSPRRLTTGRTARLHTCLRWARRYASLCRGMIS